jgi:hypothetical protein
MFLPFIFVRFRSIYIFYKYLLPVPPLSSPKRFVQNRKIDKRHGRWHTTTRCACWAGEKKKRMDRPSPVHVHRARSSRPCAMYEDWEITMMNYSSIRTNHPRVLVPPCFLASSATDLYTSTSCLNTR